MASPSQLPSTDWKESISPDEAKRFEGYATILHGLQQRHARGGTVSRALHAKGLLGLEAEFTVLPDLPEAARVALFAKPGTYRTYVRFSNGKGRKMSDTVPDARGMAIKLVGVEGKKLIPGLENAVTQDFLFVRSPATPFRSAEEFVRFVQAIASTPPDLLGLFFRFGIPRTLTILRHGLADINAPMVSMATTTYYSALPIKFGPYAVHVALMPQAAAGPNAEPGTSPDYLGEEFSTRLRSGPVVYDFKIQFYEDAVRTPIEDASVEWKSPFITVGRLTIPQQDPTGPRGRRVAEFVETLSFDPWHAVTDLRPLGNMMRARNTAYRVSTKARQAAGEPDGTERFE